MKLYGVRPVLAVAVFAAAILAACGGGGGGAVPGGGGGGGGSTPTPVPTATPPGVNFVKGAAGVVPLGPNLSNAFSSSMLGASTDGTFVIQSTDTPGRPSGSSFTLTEYNVTASESAAGVTSSTSKARVASTVGREGTNAVMPYRQHLDPRTGASPLFHGRSTMSVVPGSGRSVQSVRRVSDIPAGTVRTFHIQQGTITGVGGTCNPPQITIGTSCYIDNPATLKAVGAHSYVWVDNKIDGSYSFNQTDWNTTASTFDADYTREIAAFAPAFNANLAPYPSGNTYQQCNSSMTPLAVGAYQPTPDLSGADPHISILVTNALENTGEGGYFDFINDLSDQELNCSAGQHVPSNNLPMFVIGADKYQTSGNATVTDVSYWRTQDMVRSLPHEFQHYLHALNKVLVPDLVNTSGPRGVFDNSFIDEGDSMLAEDLVLGAGANPPQSPDSRLLAFEYMFTPGNFSLTAFAGYDVDPLGTGTTYGFFRSTAGNYGGAYLFARYLYDRFGGDAALHRVYGELSTVSSGANTQPIQTEANGEPFSQVYGEFAGALAARNTQSTDPRFMFSSNVLLDGLTTEVIPGGATWNLRFNGPRSPQDITSTTPGTLPRIKLTPGSTVTMKLITGATLFPNVAPAGGAVVSGSVTGAPASGIDGAMAQGSYADSGACFGPAPGCT